MDKEVGKLRSGVVEFYEENGVYNFEGRDAGGESNVEVVTNDGNWRKSKAHPWCEVGAFLRRGGVW